MSITLSEGEARRLDTSLTPIYVPPPLATLYGTVVDAETGYGIGMVLVEVLGAGVIAARTDEAGDYNIPDIPAGTYTISFSHHDYETKEV